MEELNRLIEEAVCSLPTNVGRFIAKVGRKGRLIKNCRGNGDFCQDSGGPNNQSLEAYQEILGEQYTYLF